MAYCLYLAYYLGSPGATSQAFLRIDAFGSFFTLVANGFLLLCSAELAAGAKAAARNVSTVAFRVIMGVLSGVVVIFSFIYFVYQQYRYTRRYSGDYDSNRSVDNGLVWVGAISVFVLIGGSFIVLVYSLIQLRATRKYAGGAYSRVGTYVAVIAGLNFLLFVWAVAASFLIGFEVTSEPGAWVIVDAILSRWGTFVILLLIYLLGVKKAGGLWSIPETKADATAPEMYNPHIQPVDRV
jgi:hypothetical protein